MVLQKIKTKKMLFLHITKHTSLLLNFKRKQKLLDFQVKKNYKKGNHLLAPLTFSSHPALERILISIFS